MIIGIILVCEGLFLEMCPNIPVAAPCWFFFTGILFIIVGAGLIDWDIRGQKRAINLTAKDKIILLISILIPFFLLIVAIYINSALSHPEWLRSQPPFEINAVDHEINNLSDMYIGFEFDNSTFTVNVDITNDSIYIWGIQPVPAVPYITLNVNNETINFYWEGQSSTYLNFLYIRWKIVDLQYGENVTFFFSGKGRAIASDLMW